MIACIGAFALWALGVRGTAFAIPFGSLLLSINMLASRRLVSKAVARAAGTEARGGLGLGLKLAATLAVFWFALKHLDAAGLVMGYVGSLLAFALSFVVRPGAP